MKYPSIEEKMKNLIKNRGEALAAHELARNHMAGRRKDMFTPFKKGKYRLIKDKSMSKTPLSYPVFHQVHFPTSLLF